MWGPLNPERDGDFRAHAQNKWETTPLKGVRPSADEAFPNRLDSLALDGESSPNGHDEKFSVIVLEGQGIKNIRHRDQAAQAGDRRDP